MLHSKEDDDVLNIGNIQWSQKTPRHFDSDVMSDVTDEDENVNDAIMAEGIIPRKKRKRNSGASDDQSFVMERHNRVYLAYKPEDQCWRFKYVLKDKGETWDEADSTIMAKMRSVAEGGKSANNAFTEREKLVQLWCDQNKINYTEGEKAAANMTNLELFVAIKKESPGLIQSGIPNPTVESVYQ